MYTQTTDKDQVRAWRQRLLDNGYTPLPNIGKMCILKGWPKAHVDEAALASWYRMRGRDTTGLRLSGGLVAIDFDVDDVGLMERLAAEFEDVCGDFLLRATSGKATEAWFVRTEQPFSRLATKKWIGPSGKTFAVEAYGGAGARQFGAFGPHTVLDDGTVTKWYEWVGSSPLEVPLGELPVMSKEQIALIIERANEIMAAAGCTQAPYDTDASSSASRVYDVTEEMTFILNTGEEGVTVEELRDRVFVGERLRCAAYPWLEDVPSHTNASRIMVGQTRDGFLCLYDHQTEQLHMEVAAKAFATVSPVELQEKFKALEERVGKGEASSDLVVGDDIEENGLKLTKKFAWWGEGSGWVVPMNTPPSGAGVMTLSGFKNTMAKYEMTEVGPRGGLKVVSPVGVWRSSPDRPVVAGLQMRPDMPYPLFDEQGSKWVNTYRPQDHSVEGGDAAMGFDFIRYLFPIDREHEYFLNSLAFKMQNPGVPGQALVLVATDYGVGRGTLKRLIELLFGTMYTSTPGFDTLAGQTYQGQYNDWMGSAVVAFVEEVESANPAGQSYVARKTQYEALKEVADPNGRWVMVKRKTLPNNATRVCVTIIISTNHRDAIQIPEGDRRFTVLSNGRKKEADDPYWARLAEWMADPANVAAFARALLSRPLGDFDSRVGIDTPAKQLMVSLSATDLDRSFERMMEEAPGPLFTHTHVSQWLQKVRDDYGYQFPTQWPGIARRIAEKRLYEVFGTLANVGSAKLVVYAKTQAQAEEWAGKDVASELALNDTKSQGPGNVARLGDYR